MPDQQIILKADDIRFTPETILSPRWQNFVDYIARQGIKAALGLIGNSLEADNPSYFNLLKDLHNSPHFEIWNHGYDHVLKGTNAAGEIYHEFSNIPYEAQKDHLQKTQRLAREKLGITLQTFGAPGNAIDDATCRAIDEIVELDIWLYGNSASKKHVLKNYDV